jgi:hypothetical protein
MLLILDFKLGISSCISYLINLRPTGRLWGFCEQIGRFRREGKNRRDTSTVATRVLRLARHAVNWGDKRIKSNL